MESGVEETLLSCNEDVMYITLELVFLHRINLTYEQSR